MGRHHLVRVGALATVGRFTSVDTTIYPRYARVIVRTGRGLEVGTVLSSPDDDLDPMPGDGSILRAIAVEDDLLIARLEKNRDSAFAACTERVAELSLPVSLMEVEQLFDGR